MITCPNPKCRQAIKNPRKYCPYCRTLLAEEKDPFKTVLKVTGVILTLGLLAMIPVWHVKNKRRRKNSGNP